MKVMFFRKTSSTGNQIPTKCKMTSWNNTSFCCPKLQINSNNRIYSTISTTATLLAESTGWVWLLLSLRQVCEHRANWQLKHLASSLLSKSSECWGEHGFTNRPIQEPRQKLAGRQSRGVRSENYSEMRSTARGWVSESLNGESYGCHCVLCSHGKSNKCILEVSQHFCPLENENIWCQFEFRMASGIAIYKEKCSAYQDAVPAHAQVNRLLSQ